MRGSCFSGAFVKACGHPHLVMGATSSGASILKALEFLGKILPLQSVNNFVRTNIKAHVGPIVVVTAHGDRHRYLPPWESFDKLLKRRDNRRPQHFQVGDKDNDFGISQIIAVNCEIASGLLWQIIGSPKPFKNLLYKRTQLLERVNSWSQ